MKRRIINILSISAMIFIPLAFAVSCGIKAVDKEKDKCVSTKKADEVKNDADKTLNVPSEDVKPKMTEEKDMGKETDVSETKNTSGDMDKVAEVPIMDKNDDMNNKVEVPKMDNDSKVEDGNDKTDKTVEKPKTDEEKVMNKPVEVPKMDKNDDTNNKVETPKMDNNPKIDEGKATNQPVEKPKTDEGKEEMCNAANNPKKDYTTAEVFEFVIKNEINKLEEYLKNGGNAELKNSQNQTLLLEATNTNNIEAAKLLLKYKASVNTQENNHDSPFLLAGARGYFDLVKLYLEHNPRFDLYNRYYGTALIPAAEHAYVDTVRLLANTPNYPINHVNNLGWTALMEAVYLGQKGPNQTETVRILVEAGADVSIPDRNGVTALQHARNRGYTDVVKILQNAQ